MTYIALNDVSQNLERVSARADAGGHAANLPVAFQEIDSVQVYDNTQGPELVMETQSGVVTYVAETTPEWPAKALWGTDYEITEHLRARASGRSDRTNSGLER